MLFSPLSIILHDNGVMEKNMEIDGKNIEFIEEELNIYNAKMRLLSWLYDEMQIQSEDKKESLNKIGQEMPLNT